MNFSLRLETALERAVASLLEQKNRTGWWEGELSSSALSTATAVVALAVYERAAPGRLTDLPGLIENGLKWIARQANEDGGWGDTPVSRTNLSTTTLCWAALGVRALDTAAYRPVVERAEAWLRTAVGGLDPERLGGAILARYGEDRTFSIPILTTCALAGRWGSGPEAWEKVIALPFELAVLPQRFFGFLGLPVVSYALPALIALGYARYRQAPPSAAIRWVRARSAPRSLEMLNRLQPSSGGFLEATPLTSFVVMSLAGTDQPDHPVTRRGLDFLRGAVRPDGSWPIDTNLTTWVTTLAVNALGAAGSAADEADRRRIRDWLLGQQYRVVHPYTNARPGGWAWTDLPGGVPDADDTAGALLALRELSPRPDQPDLEAARAGVQWLAQLQNRDGGIPTFCRGWSKLPFDRSGADLTAHAMRAWEAWAEHLNGGSRRALQKAGQRALRFLGQSQRVDGRWIPLWFGNEHAPTEENPVYGTARVSLALAETRQQRGEVISRAFRRGVSWLIEAQAADGSWGEGSARTGSIEESGLALASLSAALGRATAEPPILRARLARSVERGTEWLVEQVETERWRRPAPIGFYFARLWYYEKLYPLIATVEGLGRARASLKMVR